MKLRKMLALMLALAMALGALTACGGSAASEPAESAEAPAEEEAEAPAEEPAEEPESEPAEEPAEEPEQKTDPNTPLVVGYSPFSSKFSPFFAETAYDQDAASMTQLGLYPLDRLGQVVFKGIEGETIPYNGTDYTYTGPADIEIVENEDGTADYNITLRDDLVFSDGEPVTIDDVIFSMYVILDPTYDGSATLSAMPITGLADYTSGMTQLLGLLLDAGEDNTDFSLWDEETQQNFWKEVKVALPESIKGYLVANGYNAEEDTPDVWMANWGFEVPAEATDEEIFDIMLEQYEGDAAALYNTEKADGIDAYFENYDTYTVGVQTGEAAPNVAGIKKTGDYSMTVSTDYLDAQTIYQIGVSIAPMHYYGDASLYDYDNNMFGFPKGDLSLIRSKTTEPMGAGPYKFIKFENGVINFEANENYFKGEPKTKYINFREVQDVDKKNGVVAGDIDVTDPSFNKDVASAIAQENGGELTGDVITTSLVDNLGYGYIALNAANVNVGGDPGSDASKNLRKAFATIFSVYRDVAIDSYYGDAAEVINYPISNTSWAAPHATDEGYALAFSKDVDGNDIYTSDMSPEDKYEAAKAAALGFFEAAGYTVEDGKVTAAPEGAKLEYEVMIPADGTGDHPAFMILTEAKTALEEIGINLIINDLSNSSDLWTALEAVQGEMWCAAWGATPDPDMTQVYYSDVENGPTTEEGKNPFGGPAQGGSSYMYCIADEELDELIIDARMSTDQAYRKEMYKACLDIIIDWACEIPTYQRQNCIIFSTERVNIDTVTPDITTYYGWMSEIENIELK